MTKSDIDHQDTNDAALPEFYTHDGQTTATELQARDYAKDDR